MLNRLESEAPFTLIIIAPEDKNHPQLNEHLERLGTNSRVHWLKDYWGKPEVITTVLKAIGTVPELSKEYRDAVLVGLVD